MWNRRDWAVLGSAAVGAFGLTLAMFWASPLEAGNSAPLTESIKIPTYTINTCKVTANLIENDQVEGAKDNVVFLKGGALPKLQLVLVNSSADKDTDAPIHVEMRSASARDRVGRLMQVRPPVFSEDYSLNLKPGETKTLDIPFDKVTTADGDSLTLFISKQVEKNNIIAVGVVTNNAVINTPNIQIVNGGAPFVNTLGPDAIQLLRMAVQPMPQAASFSPAPPSPAVQAASAIRSEPYTR